MYLKNHIYLHLFVKITVESNVFKELQKNYHDLGLRC